jgi:hypothetical protein
MNKIKNILIVTVFLYPLLQPTLILSLSEDAEQVLGQADAVEPLETEDIITEPISSEETLLRSPLILSSSKDEGQAEKQTAFFPQKKHETIKQQHYAFAPTVDKIKKEDHQRMLQQGRPLMHSSS